MTELTYSELCTIQQALGLREMLLINSLTPLCKMKSRNDMASANLKHTTSLRKKVIGEIRKRQSSIKCKRRR